jgi:hypothetical protein
MGCTVECSLWFFWLHAWWFSSLVRFTLLSLLCLSPSLKLGVSGVIVFLEKIFVFHCQYPGGTGSRVFPSLIPLLRLPEGLAFSLAVWKFPTAQASVILFLLGKIGWAELLLMIITFLLPHGRFCPQSWKRWMSFNIGLLFLLPYLLLFFFPFLGIILQYL